MVLRVSRLFVVACVAILLLSSVSPSVVANELMLTVEERQWVKDNPVIRVQSDTTFAPFDYQQEEKPSGYSIGYIELLAERLGLDVEYVSLPWRGMFNAASNQVDVITSVAYTAERSKFYRFTSPYFRSSLSIVKHKSATWLDRFDDLNGAVVAVSDGNARIQLLNDHLKNVNITTVNSIAYALQAVENSRADATLVDTKVANFLIPMLSLHNVEVIELSHYFGDRYQQFRFAVPLRHQRLATLLNKAILSVTDEDRAALAQRWFNDDTSVQGETNNADGDTDSNFYIAVALSTIGFVLLLFVLSVLKKQNVRPIDEQIKAMSRWAAISSIMFVVALLALSEWDLQQLHTSIKRDRELFLNTSVYAAQDSLDKWADTSLEQMQRFEQSKRLQLLLSDFAHYSKQEVLSKGVAELREITDNSGGLTNLLDLSVIDSDGTVLLSFFGDRIGQKHQISVDRADMFERLINGESLMMHSYKAALPTRGVQSWQAALYFAIPVTSVDERPLFLVAMLDPEGRFSELLTTISPSASGETYAFNSDGMVISKLRHRKDLETAGLLRANESPVLRISLRDPGSELKPGNQLFLGKVEQLPFTKMAQSALRGEMSSDLEGYRDYRGVKVIGAWVWDSAHGIGLATEIDYSEALRTYNDARTLANFETGLTVLAALTIIFIGFRAAGRITVALQQSNLQLAEKVDERTAELKSERRRLQVMIDNVPAVLFMKDSAGRLLMANSFVEQLLATPLEQLIGKTNEQVLNKYSASRVSLIERRVLETKQPQQFESDSERIFTGELANRQYFISYVPVLDDSGNSTAVVGLYLDISDRKQLEQKLIEARDTAEKASRAKSDFLATMSHEIRTPLNGVIGMLHLVLKTELSPQQYHQLDTAFSSAKTLLALINDILDFSKIEAGRFDLDNVDFIPSSIIEEVCNTLSAKADEKRLEFVLDLTELPSVMVKGDPVRLRQILLNLVGNAIKFTDRGEVIITAVLIAQENGDYRFRCSVTDSGIGIAKEQLPLLFSAFTQVDSGTHREFEGSGLGLAITRRLCRLMGGEVEVESQLGQGSTFTVDVLLRRSDVIYNAPKRQDISHAQVLIVDDNHINREVLKRQLQDWGVTVTEIANSLDVLPFCLQESAPIFDVILTDMNMPNVDGSTLARMIRNHAKLAPTKILLLPSTNYLGSKEELLEAGIDGCLGKPLMPEDLYHALSVLIHEGDQLRPQRQVVTEAYLKARGSFEQTLQAPKEEQPSWGVGKRILLVDDNITNQLVAQGFVESLMIDCVVANNGREALDRLRESPVDQPFHLVLMDCQMPIMNGYDATKEIRRGAAGDRYHRVPVVAMTAHAMASDRDKCIQSGMDDYLSKPVDFDRCQDVLFNWLMGNTSQRSAFIKSVENHANESQALEQTPSTLLIPQGLATIDFDNQRPPVADLPDVYLKSLKAYCHQYERIEDKLAPFFSPTPATNVLADEAHAIKGSSGNLGMMSVYRLAEKIEHDAKAQVVVSAHHIDELIALVVRSMQDAQLIIKLNQRERTFATSSQRDELYLPLCKQLLKRLENDEVVETELLDNFIKVAHSHDDEKIIEAIEGFEYDTAMAALYKVINSE